jgi:PIN domain of ribonuclease
MTGSKAMGGTAFSTSTYRMKQLCTECPTAEHRNLMSALQPRCKKLVLDAGPLLSLSPLRGLAETYFTVPQVLTELKDKRAQEHFERLGLQAGVQIEVRSPDPASLAHGVCSQSIVLCQTV